MMDKDKQVQEAITAMTALQETFNLNNHMREAWDQETVLTVTYDSTMEAPKEGKLSDIPDLYTIVNRFASRNHAVIYYVVRSGPFIVMLYVDADEDIWSFCAPRIGVKRVYGGGYDIRKSKCTIRKGMVKLRGEQGYLVIDC